MNAKILLQFQIVYNSQKNNSKTLKSMMVTSCKFTGICYFLAFNKESAVHKEQVNILHLGSLSDLFLCGLCQQPGVVLGRDPEGLLSILVQVLYVGQVPPGGGPDLVLDCVQHFNVQQFKLKIRLKLHYIAKVTHIYSQKIHF